MKDKTEPIMTFKDEEELRTCGKEWVDILYLNDWIIKFNLIPVSENPNEQGHGCLNYALKSARIDIVKQDEGTIGRIVKFCHEQTLVHELLHCKYNLIDENGETYEGVFLEMHQHQMLEEMARSLIRVKYNLNADWFINF